MKKVCITLVLLPYVRSIAELKCLLNKESWQGTLKILEVNATLQVIMDIVCYYFNIAFPRKSPSGHTTALGSTQPLTETSTRCISWG
jgi:hypothetical protein